MGPGLQSRGPLGQTGLQLQASNLRPWDLVVTPLPVLVCLGHIRISKRVPSSVTEPSPLGSSLISAFPGLIHPPQDFTQAVSSTHDSLPRGLYAELHNLRGQFKCHLRSPQELVCKQDGAGAWVRLHLRDRLDPGLTLQRYGADIQ